MVEELIGDAARGASYAMARLRVAGDRIVAADVPGMARDLVGLTLLEAASVPGETLAADALANAIGPAFRAAPRAGRVAVALSGGVDSAVALLRAGPDAIGVTLRLWADPDGPAAERVCCSPSAVIRARETCHRLGLPHVTLDLREPFLDRVVEPFVADYAAALTPNPCMRCNGLLRFGALVEFAERAGADVVWTGHYARVVERDGLRLVARGVDPLKDQSYMLATVEPGLLEHVGFPLGESTKEEVRAEARSAGLEAAGRPESQEACFLAGDDYRSFLARRGVADEPGPIVDLAGAPLGTHRGLWRFTPGQRRGVGVASSKPLFVIGPDRARNALLVGPREALRCTTIEAHGRLHVAVERAEAKLRYRSPPVAAEVDAHEGGFTLHLDDPVEAVAPGQVAVLYDDDTVVGSGVIARAE